MIPARTDAREAAEAAEALCTQFGSAKPKLVVLFASRDRDHQALNRALRERLPKETRLLGASSAGEIDREGMHQGSAVAAALSGDFEVGIGLGTGLSRDAASAGDSAIRSAAQQLGARADELGTKKHVALVIDDGFRNKKEELLLGVMSMNQALVAVGGGAGSPEMDPSKQSALVHVDGEVVSDAAAVALFRTDVTWAALRSHWFAPTGKTLRITKVDSSATRALEIDGKPAAPRYAELLGLTIPELAFGAPNGFAAQPTALRVGREYFIRSALAALPDNSILFANLLEEGSELELVKLTNMADSTRRFLTSELHERLHTPSATLLFHCNGRAMFAAMTGNTPALSETFRAAPTPSIGMNCHFETYCGFHINNTLTSLVFGASA